MLGEETSPRVARVVTFADEIKPSEDSRWAYLCVVSVPQPQLKEAYARLREDRKACDYDFEIGWSDLKKPGRHAKPGGKEQLATRWLNRIVHEHELWRFSVMGIDTERLLMEHFGEGKGCQLTNAYRRFYRANLKLHVSSVHRGHDQVEVVKSYHDKEGRLEADEWFSWHPNAVVSARETVRFTEPDICFVDSCHHKEERHKQASEFIQLCDIIAGATRYAFEGLRPNQARDRVVKELMPLLERMNNSKSRGNINSRYKYVGRATLSFFPSRQLSEAEMDDQFARGTSTFFCNRPMKLTEAQSKQERLF